MLEYLRSESALDMRVRRNGLVFAICVDKLLHVLSDEIKTDAVPCEKSEVFLNDFQLAEGREFVDQHQELVFM